MCHYATVSAKQEKVTQRKDQHKPVTNPEKRIGMTAGEQQYCFHK
jgi:putative hemolysin